MGWLAYVDTEEHPATRFLGTTWIKLEDVFIKGTKSGEVSGQAGGSNTKTIAKANLPAVKVQVDSFTLTTQPHTHTVNIGMRSGYQDRYVNTAAYIGGTGANTSSVSISTGTASPYTSALGSGTPLDITPAYYTVHIWKRLT